MAGVISSILELTNEAQALVAVAVLLDGREAARFLATDADIGDELSAVANMLANLAPDLRSALVATILRAAIQGGAERV